MRIENDGIGLYVEDVGEEKDPAVVFLHGVGMSAESYRWLPPEVMRGRRILRIDLRGHGRSGRAPGTYTLDQYADDVAAIVRERVGRPAVLVGHSLGACIAWSLAQQRPDIVSAALLEDPPLFFGNREIFERSGNKEIFRAIRGGAVTDQVEGKSEEEIAARLRNMPVAAGLSFGEVATEDAVHALAFGTRHLDPGVIDGAIDSSTLAPLNTTAPVNTPILILAADTSLGAAFTSEHITWMARSHPDVDVVTITGSGHIIHGSRAHRSTYLKYLSEFLARHA